MSDYGDEDSDIENLVATLDDSIPRTEYSSEADNESTDENCEEVEIVKFKRSKYEFAPEQGIRTVESLPSDVNGDRSYIVAWNEKGPYLPTRDCWNWGKPSTNRAGMIHIKELVRKCRGSFQCLNENCMVFQRWDTISTSFKTVSGQCICTSCGLAGEIGACPARKVTLCDYSKKTMLVKHMGIHACSPNKLLKSPGQSSVEHELSEVFRCNPDIKPSVAKRNLITRFIKEGDYEKADTAATVAMNRKNVYNIKQKVMANSVHELTMSGVFTLKAEFAKKGADPYYIFVAETNFVVCSSKEKVGLLIELSTRSGPLGENLISIDGCHKSVRGMKALMMSYYDPELQQIVNLVSCYCLQENAENISKLLRTADAMCTLEGSKFAPFGFIDDKAGSLQAGILIWGGEDALKKNQILRKPLDGRF